MAIAWVDRRVTFWTIYRPVENCTASFSTTRNIFIKYQLSATFRSIVTGSDGTDGRTYGQRGTYWVGATEDDCFLPKLMSSSESPPYVHVTTRFSLF